MKNLSIVALLVLSMLNISCSGNDSEPTDPVDAGIFEDGDFFNFSDNGIDAPIVTWDAIRKGNLFEIRGSAEDGRAISLKFRADGVLKEVTTFATPESHRFPYSNYFHYASHFFDFEIVSIDEINKIVEVTYDGNVYYDSYQTDGIDGSFSPIAGNLRLHYTEQVATPNSEFAANINGNEWVAVKYLSTVVAASGEVTILFFSDDAHFIKLEFNRDYLIEGTYNFTNSHNTKLSLAKYNPTTHAYGTHYVSSGTLIITNKSYVNVSDLVVTGTFNFTALDTVTNQEIQVTNGSFNWKID